MLKDKNKIFISAGGTGGHIIPARCLAIELSKRNYQVFLLGDEKYRSYIKSEDGFASLIINSSQLSKKPLKIFFAALKITHGTIQSLRYFLQYRPKYVVTFGGYATFPILIAALLTKTKIIIHEQNSHLGKVNRIFAKYANKIALSFAQTSGICPQYLSKTTFTGNPIRDEISQLNSIPYLLPCAENSYEKNVKEALQNRMGYNVILASDFAKESKQNNDLFNILVIGGSGGAKIFSEILPRAFFNFSDNLKSKISITQQCRKELVQSTFAQYRNFNLNIEIQSFFVDMPQKIKNAHLIIGRSGSSSIFEFCAAKRPMILIPFAESADNHQEKNARFLEKNGAAIVISEKEFTISNISKILQNLINNYTMLEKMSQAAASLAVINATTNLVKLLE
ncbi:MAG: undecaprenyldiphospho-muramoylpentapeptide beta-N-acetylglucosaminyltransferase [Rickettsiales bacterium]|nr:undecaprenyldiphospho-muramoylpentapeptide beta-N-acetylglucosaminyltransferase [Rickettsiales bacterium]